MNTIAFPPRPSTPSVGLRAYDAPLLRMLAAREGRTGYLDLCRRARAQRLQPNEVFAWIADARGRGLIEPAGYDRNDRDEPVGGLRWRLTPRGRQMLRSGTGSAFAAAA